VILDVLKAISRKQRMIGSKLVLITNRKSYMSFDWYQSQWPWMTLNGIMALIMCYFPQFSCTMSSQNNY